MADLLFRSDPAGGRARATRKYDRLTSHTRVGMQIDSRRILKYAPCAVEVFSSAEELAVNPSRELSNIHVNYIEKRK